MAGRAEPPPTGRRSETQELTGNEGGDGNEPRRSTVVRAMQDKSGRRIRTREPVREQGLIVYEIPEDALPEDHTARLLWRVVETLDLSRFLSQAKAVEGQQGRRVLSVRVLLTVWLYAISRGIGSAREIERSLTSDAAFRWIIGDLSLGRTRLSEFRVEYGEALDRLFTDDFLGATLMQRDLVRLDLVAQDGTRVRASASAPSPSTRAFAAGMPRTSGAARQGGVCLRGRPRR